MRTPLAWLIVVGAAAAGCATTGFKNLPETDRAATCQAIAAGLDWGEVARCSAHGILGASALPQAGLQAIRLDLDILVNESGHVRNVELVQSPQPVVSHAAIARCLSYYLFNKDIPGYTAAKSTVVPVTVVFSARPPASGTARYATTPEGCTVEFVGGRSE